MPFRPKRNETKRNRRTPIELPEMIPRSSESLVVPIDFPSAESSLVSPPISEYPLVSESVLGSLVPPVFESVPDPLAQSIFESQPAPLVTHFCNRQRYKHKHIDGTSDYSLLTPPPSPEGPIPTQFCHSAAFVLGLLKYYLRTILSFSFCDLYSSRATILSRGCIVIRVATCYERGVTSFSTNSHLGCFLSIRC